MKQIKYFSAFTMTLVLLLTLGCAPTPTRESTGQYLDDVLITSKVKTAIFNEPTLKSAEINVETFKGVVQLSGFVSSESDISKAVSVASSIGGVKRVNNDMRTKLPDA